jgi:hypothetical protein
MFSLPSRRCATTHTKSSIPEGSSKTDTHVGAFGLVEGAPEPIAIDAELHRVASLSPAATAICFHPKVSESRSPRLHDVVGEDLAEFGEQERR